MLNEKVLDDPIFESTDELDEEFFKDAEKELAKRGVAYPSFVKFSEDNVIRKVLWDPETNTYSVEHMPDTWSSIKDLHSALDTHIQAKRIDVEVDAALESSPEVQRVVGQTVFFENHGEDEAITFGRVEDRILEINQFYAFLRLAKRWMATPDDVVLAYSFIQYHPAFWYQHVFHTNKTAWISDNGMKPLWISPAYDEGSLVVMMEIGSAIPPERTKHYREHRLDVWGSSFEDAYIQLAKKVHTFYHLDGSERKDAAKPEIAVPQP